MSPTADLMSRLRARDVEELHECGMTPEAVALALQAPAVEFKLWRSLHGPAAFVAFHAITPRALQISMLATDDWPFVARDVYRWGVRECRPRLLALGFTRAECRTMDGHDDAIRFLDRLGFRPECRLPGYGSSGRTFIQYAWRLDDHVPISP